ncbi:MAG: F0F1 ATP synthase subunit epsilon [Muribaculaceae bacterium]|nr:F0F1 ATP synthase subunit epsilon [Muribaculaceae bacterium]MDE6487430.1 F0F1 ATP synthase subunit epsilon [Muribaculaceae bacterium]
MTLKIISAAEVLFEGEVKAATLPGSMGAFTVLHNHASLVAMLSAGTVRYELPDGSEQSRPIPGGVADVDNNVISVCVY